ncbi:hydrolase [Bacillus sp. CGMCC 1.16607]|uniref:hydrolase n=1 Tax=Bacillus sp. CGMCC 1.16607 TaxID=3351842 RepID=UPI003631AEAD
MENRNFILDTEWNMIHYSEKPNGFGILIIGDERHFVDEHKSFWTQNEGKQLLLTQLKESGYTIFYSNLYGKHWGTNRATWLAERLYHHIMRTEILNSKIHIIAEGMGALIVMELLKTLGKEIRSVVFLNPIFSLKYHLEQEKEHKFFYKKLLNEISHAYECERRMVDDKINEMVDFGEVIPTHPLKVIHILSGRRAYNQSEFSKKMLTRWETENSHIYSSFILPEKKQQLGKMIVEFFHPFEQIL